MKKKKNLLQIMKMYKKSDLLKRMSKVFCYRKISKKSHFKSVDTLTFKGFEEFLDRYCK